MKLEFHHINFVSKDVPLMNNFYRDILGMDEIPVDKFPRTKETKNRAFQRRTTENGYKAQQFDKHMQTMHRYRILARQYRTVHMQVLS